MNIAYICADPGIPVFGHKGSSIHVQEMIRAFSQWGINVTLFTPRLGGIAPPDLAAIPVVQLPAIPPGDPAQREQAAIALNQETLKALADAGPFDAIYERYSLWSLAGMSYAQDKAIPGILEVNAPLIEEQARYRPFIHREQAKQIAAHVFNSAKLLVAVSEEIATYLERYLITPSPIQVIPNGVNPERFPINLKSQFSWAQLGDNQAQFTIGFVGSLRPWHGLPVLVETFDQLFQQYPQSRLLIVGDGPERDRLEADLEQRRLRQACHLTGMVPPDQVPGFLAAMDVAVAPYPQQAEFYFSPLKVYEAMAAGIPVVASRIGQLDQLIEPGKTGLLCPAGDAAALANALEQLVLQPQLGDRLGRAGRQQVLQHHTWKAAAQKILNLAQPTLIAEMKFSETAIPQTISREFSSVLP